MADTIPYFSKSARFAYTVGPSGFGVVQSGFTTSYVAWHEINVGIKIQKESEYLVAQNGQYISGSDEILSTESLSVAFDSGSRFWGAIHNGIISSLFLFTGVTPSSINFTGLYPQLYMNSLANASQKYLYCFYGKQNDDSIYFRYSQNNFSTEYLFHSNLEKEVGQLVHAGIDEGNTSCFSVYGKFEDGIGFKLTSSPFDGGSNVATDFSATPSGGINQPLELLGAGNCSIFLRDFYQSTDYSSLLSGLSSFPDVFSNDLFSVDSFSDYATGDVTIFNKGVNMEVGEIWL